MRAEWIIVDAVADRVMSLLNVGEATYKGVSVRKNLSRRARGLLYERLEDAVLHGTVYDEEREYEGQRWRVVVVPILSPTTHTPVGARAVYVEAGQPVPPAPELGAMEWVITPDGQRSSAWDRAMYGIYELNPEGPTATQVNPGVWLAQFVAREDQARIIKLIATSVDRAQMLGRSIIAYHIVTLHSRKTKLLEMSVSKHHAEDGHIYLRGFTREIPAADGDETMPGEVEHLASAAEAWSELLADIPLARIDWRNHRLFEVSLGWHRAGLADPGEGGLLELIEVVDRERVRAAMESYHGREGVGKVERVLMRTSAGDERLVDLTFRSLPSRYGIMRVHPCAQELSLCVAHQAGLEECSTP